MKPSKFQVDEKGQMLMTFKNIQLYNEEGGLFGTPELNQQLYLHYKGFHKIQNLERYSTIKALYLNNNAITKIENLDGNPLLISLYLNNNLIQKMEGLSKLTDLVILNLSHNRIEKIEGLGELKKLTNLILSTNRLTSYEGIVGVGEAVSLQNLDLSNNQIEPNEETLNIFGALPQLACLYLRGTPFPRQFKNYRKVAVAANKQLTFLDDRPVSEMERRLTEAWAKGGAELENIEKTKIYQEKEQQRKKEFSDYEKRIAPAIERRKYIFQSLSTKEREELAILKASKQELGESLEDKLSKDRTNTEIERLEKYLQWLQDAMSSTSVVEGCKPQDYSIERVGDHYKLRNRYDQQKKKEYEEKQNSYLKKHQESKSKEEPSSQAQDVEIANEEEVEQQDQEVKQRRQLMARFNTQLIPLLQSYLEKYKFDFEEVYPQFNMAAGTIYRKLNQEPVRFDGKELKKIWTIIEQQKRDELDQLD